MPKPYIRKMPATWWLRKRAYFWFMMRELSAVFVAGYCVMLMVFLWSMKQGVSRYEDLLGWMQGHIWTIGVHFIALVFAAYHSITWFNLLPKVIVLRQGEEKVPGIYLVSAHYVAWFVISAVLICLVFKSH